MPRKALRCSVELDIHCVSCPGVYLPRRDDVYLSISLFKDYRRTQLALPTFPLLFHEKFKFDKVFFTAYQPQQVAEQLENDSIRIELVQLSDIRSCGRILAYYEANARDFLYPYPEFTTSYGCADRFALMERTIDFPGIAPRLEFSSNTMIREIDHIVGTDSRYITGNDSYNSYSSHRPRTSYSPYRGRSLTRRRSARKKTPRKRSKSVSYHHRRPTLASIFHCRSVSPEVNRLLRDMTLYDSTIDDDKPPFVVRKVKEDLIGRIPGIKRPCRHQTRRARSRSRSRSRSSLVGAGASYLDDDYRVVGRSIGYSPKVLREPVTDYYSSTEDNSDAFSDVSDPGPSSYYTRSYRSPRSPRRYRSPSPILNRSSLRDRYEDVALGLTIQKKVDEAIQRNRSRERAKSRERARSRERAQSRERARSRERALSRDRLNRAPARGSLRYEDDDDDFEKIKELERDLEIARNRSLVHVNDGEYWTEKAAQYQGKSHRDMFNSNLKKTYEDIHESYKKKFDDRVY